MKSHRIMLATMTVGLSVLASRAGAAIIVTDGTLHVSGYDSVAYPYYQSVDAPPDAISQNPGGDPTTYPPRPYPPYPWFPPFPPYPPGDVLVPRALDQPFVSPYASAGAGNHDTAEEWVSSGARVEISTDITLLSNLVVADAWGDLTITEDAPETMQVGISTVTDGFSFLAQVSLDAAGGGNVFSIEGNGYEDPPDLLIPLSRGQYKLTWSTEGGTGSGYGSSYFTIGAVPEPSAGLLLIAPGVIAFLRRGPQR